MDGVDFVDALDEDEDEVVTESGETVVEQATEAEEAEDSVEGQVGRDED